MARVKIADLSLLEEIGQQQLKGIFGGWCWKWRWVSPRPGRPLESPPSASGPFVVGTLTLGSHLAQVSAGRYRPGVSTPVPGAFLPGQLALHVSTGSRWAGSRQQPPRA